MTPAQLRKELGELVLRAESVLAHAEHNLGNGFPAVMLRTHLRDAIPALQNASNFAGKLLVAQLTDKDRAQADEAAGRA